MSKVATYTESEFLRKYQERVAIHRLVPFPKYLELLGPLKGKRIVDVGSGSGELAHMMARKGARVVGVDPAARWIALCTDRYSGVKNLSFVQASGTRMSFIKSGSVDAVVMNMVLLNLATLTEVRGVIKEAGRILKPGGVFIFSDLHPICKMSPVVPPLRYQKNPPSFSYFTDGSEFVAGIKLKKGVIEFKDKHWTLETITTILEKAGLLIYRLSEPTYNKKAPAIFRKLKAPEYLLIACKKIAK